jgi:BASS family bile acid:Na+ symporter
MTPHDMEVVQTWAEKIAVLGFLLTTMLALGLKLSPQATVMPLRNPRLVALVVGLNFVLAPALAWLLSVMIPLAPGHVTGLLLLGTAAGAPFLPKLVETARGDSALAVALMVFLTLGTLVFMPLAAPLMLPGLDVSASAIAGPIAYLIILPLAVGMVARHRFPSLAQRAAPGLAKAGNLGLALLVAVLVAFNFPALAATLGRGAPAAAALLVTGLSLAGWVLGGGNRELRGTLALATGGRNFAAAIAPVQTSIPDVDAMMMIILGAVVSLVVLFPAAAWIRRASAAPELP